MRRREFIGLVGGAVMWPLRVRAQPPTLPVIGFLHEGSPESAVTLLAAFRAGLRDTGYEEGQHFVIEFRWAQGKYDRLQELAADLVGRRVTLIVTPGGTPASLAAKAATTAIPIVFGIGGDPVQLGLVTSLNRPGGNVTGISILNSEIMTKRLGYLHELLPGATRFAVLVNPDNPLTVSVLKELRAAVSSLGGQLEVFTASAEHQIDAAFVTLAQRNVQALLYGPDVFYLTRRTQLIALAARYKVPTIHNARETVEAGALMSYGPVLAEQYRLAGNYCGRILNGDKPGELPTLLSTKFELIVNLKTAKALGLEIPARLLTLADEVIE
jgi:putative tryptophan/tyrosine transport system substrate-binding protein